MSNKTKFRHAKEKLLPVSTEELIFADGESLSTQLILDDYEWMDYKLITHFTTSQGHLSICFEFFGSTKSEMVVAKTTKDWRGEDLSDENMKTECNMDTVRFVYAFPTEVYREYLKRFLTEHMKQWEKDAPAFYGKDIVMEFYNAVVSKYKPSVFYPDKNGDFPVDAYPPSLRSTFN